VTNHVPRSSKPLVTAVVPTYNRAHCLPRALDSIYAQEGLGEHFDIEVVVVDDGSTDGTAEAARRYPELNYVRLPGRRGVSAALNAGVHAGTGDFVTFLGDDDWWLPHKLRAQVPLLEQHPEVGVVYGQTVVRLGDRSSLYPKVGQAPSGWVFSEMLLDSFCEHHAAALMRREALDAAGDFDETLVTCEDYDLSLRIAPSFPFLFQAGAVTVYNLSAQGSYLSRVTSGRHLDDRARVVEKALSTLPDTEGYEGIRQAARARNVLVSAYAVALTGDVPRAEQMLFSSLQIYPWAIRHGWGWQCIRDLAHEHVHGGRSPLPVVRDLYEQVKVAAAPHGAAPSQWLRLLADLQFTTARKRLSVLFSSATG
jgi:GT2 family glycosyltransferase